MSVISKISDQTIFGKILSKIENLPTVTQIADGSPGVGNQGLISPGNGLRGSARVAATERVSTLRVVRRRRRVHRVHFSAKFIF